MTDNEQCGTCWRLTYPGSGKSITVLAVDHAGAGFNIALDALNDLTNGAICWNDLVAASVEVP